MSKIEISTQKALGFRQGLEKHLEQGTGLSLEGTPFSPSEVEG